MRRDPRTRSRFAFALAAALLGAPAAAQLASLPQDDSPVALTADRVTYDAETGRLTAEGEVVIHYGARTLTAARVIYDSRADRIEAEGPLVLRGPEGAVIAADGAELDARLRDALILGARAALPEGARFAAAEARRIDGRWNVMSRTVFSPCEVCAADPVPLWRIRAERVLHDEVERQVHYENATFDILGQPVFWTPYLRHPDPTLSRASGFLPPDYLQSDVFGQAIKVPWHWVIDDHSDATITPFLTTKDGPLLEGEYRRRFETGSLWLSGAITHQDYDGSDALHGFVFGEGLWRVAPDTTLGPVEAGFSLQQASDDPFLRRYRFSNRDRLTTEGFVRASDAQGWAELAAVRFQSLREGEPAGQIPTALPVFEARRVWPDAVAGGALGLDLSGYALARNRGQDTARASAGVDWERRWISDAGLSLGAYAAVRGDAWAVRDAAPGADPRRERLAPLASVEARYPLMRRDADGDLLSPLTGGGAVTHLIEPIAQAVAAPRFDGRDHPDEDSRLTEFDETALFALRRHAGFDGFEEGPRLNLGLRYARIEASGARASVSFGRVFRPEAVTSFVPGTGLNARRSDFVGAWSYEVPGVVSVANRLRLDDGLELRRNEVYASAGWGPLSGTASYAYLGRDAVTPADRHEIAGAGRVELTRNWFVGTELRRDLEARRWVRTAAEIGYVNECVDVVLTAGRDFTRLTDAPPDTFYGVRVRLWALGGDEARRGRVSGPCAPVRR